MKIIQVNSITKQGLSCTYFSFASITWDSKGLIDFAILINKDVNELIIAYPSLHIVGFSF